MLKKLIVSLMMIGFFSGCVYTESALQYAKEGTNRVQSGYDAKAEMTKSNNDMMGGMISNYTSNYQNSTNTSTDTSSVLTTNTTSSTTDTSNTSTNVSDTSAITNTTSVPDVSIDTTAGTTTIIK